MNQNEEIFNDLYSKRYGEIYIPKIEDKEIIDNLNYINNKLNNYYSNKKVAIITPTGVVANKDTDNINNALIKNPPHINVYLINNNDTNAFASKINNSYYIGIFLGTFNSLNELFDYIVNDESFNNIKRLGIVKKDIMINKLNHICIDFLCMHEFFHIMNGHCDLVKEMGIKELCEKNIENQLIDVEKGLLLQTLEYDADCCAIASIVNEEIRGYIISLKALNLNMSMMAGVYESFKSFLCTVVVSLYTLYQILDSANMYKNNYTEDYLLKRKHPINGLRIWYILYNISCVVASWRIFDKQQNEQLFSDVMDTLVQYIKFNKDIIPPYFIIDVLNHDIYKNHIQKIHNNWANVINMINSNYIELAPYTDFDYSKIFM